MAIRSMTTPDVRFHHVPRQPWDEKCFFCSKCSGCHGKGHLRPGWWEFVWWLAAFQQSVNCERLGTTPCKHHFVTLYPFVVGGLSQGLTDAIYIYIYYLMEVYFFVFFSVFCFFLGFCLEKERPGRKEGRQEGRKEGRSWPKRDTEV